MSRYEFHFENLDRDPELEKFANLKLAQILALAPRDASALGRIEFNERFFISTAEVKSRHRTFVEKAGGTTPHSAARRALERLEDKLYRWRFGGGTDTSLQPFQNVPSPQLTAD